MKVLTPTTPKGYVIGEKVATEMMTFWIDEGIFSAFYSKIQLDGKMVLIKDDSYKTGRVHAMTRKEARRLAEERRDALIKKFLEEIK